MSFQVSPGVRTREVSLTNVVPAVSSSIGAYAGQFSTGPVGRAVLISSETELVETFGAPSTRGSVEAASFLTAASFLKYGNALWVSRVKPDSMANAASGNDAQAFYEDSDGTMFDQTDATLVDDVYAKDPGALGDSLRVEIVHKDNPTFSNNDFDVFNSTPGTSTWAASRGVKYDEVHIVVVDEDGDITGTPNTILESWEGLSVIKDAKKTDGTANFVCDVINNNSQYIRIPENAFSAVFAMEGDQDSGGNLSSAFGLLLSEILATAADSTSDSDSDIGINSLGITASTELRFSLTGGADGSSDGALPTAAQIQAALNLFEDKETIDVSLIFCQTLPSSGNHATVVGHLQTLCESRKDCIGFVSPYTTVSASSTAVKDFFDGIDSSSYLVFDSTPVYVYNRYADEYVWIPACGHVAGLCARTDTTNDAWFSPAGFNRGQLLGVTKVRLNPKQADRDLLYKARINPIVSFPGEGIVLYGDKTAQSKPDAFDRINVRRLFIVLEKAIALAAKYQLFELNDEFTRAMFRNMVEPFLRDIRGRRGITDFAVVCDETNNTSEVVDQNRFVADIYIKPARSINYITLSFVATRTGVDFNEIAGTRG